MDASDRTLVPGCEDGLSCAASRPSRIPARGRRCGGQAAAGYGQVTLAGLRPTAVSSPRNLRAAPESAGANRPAGEQERA
jgi:hypothetical protein